MRKFHSIAALCGDGLRPELQELFDRLAVDPHSEVFVRSDGMVQSGPDPVSETNKVKYNIPPSSNSVLRRNVAQRPCDRFSTSRYDLGADGLHQGKGRSGM
jgi:hypothetical protein